MKQFCYLLQSNHAIVKVTTGCQVNPGVEPIVRQTQASPTNDYLLAFSANFCLLKGFHHMNPGPLLATYFDDAFPLVRIGVEERRAESCVDVDRRTHHVEHHVDVVLRGF